MSTRPGRRSRPEEPVEWEDISRAVILQPRLPEDGPDEEDGEMLEAFRRMREARWETSRSSLIGCGCLGAVGLIGATITLLLSVLMLIGGKAGTFSRQLVEGPLFQGPALTSAEIWGTLIAPSILLIVIGVPLTVLGIRELRRHTQASG